MGEFCSWSRDQYNSESERQRSTDLKKLVGIKGPREYYFDVVNPPPRPHRSANEIIQPKVDDLVKGNLLHDLVLQGQVNWEVCGAKVGTVEWKEAVEHHAGRTIIKPQDELEILAWRDGLMRNPSVRKALEREAFAENVILFSEFAFTGDSEPVEVPCKAQIDRMYINGEIDDLKTTKAKSRREFERDMLKYNYHFSAAFYERARNSIDGFRGFDAPFHHIVVQKSYPFHAYRWEIERSTWMAMGHASVDKALSVLVECRQRQGDSPEGQAVNAWPDLEDCSEPMAAEPWVMDRYAEMAVR